MTDGGIKSRHNLISWAMITTQPNNCRGCGQVPIPSHLCYCCGSLNSFRGGADYIDHPFRLGEHGHVTALKLIGCGTHALRCEAFEFQLGFDLQAVPSTPWLKMSAAGAKCVAQTTFFSCSDRSPAKHSTPSGNIQALPSATST